MFDSTIYTFQLQKDFFKDLPHEKMISRVKNLHYGKRAFVIGNGPSLTTADLDHLTEEITFAANKIYLAYEKLHFALPTGVAVTCWLQNKILKKSASLSTLSSEHFL